MSAIAGLILAASLILAQEESPNRDYFDDADSDANEVLTFDEIRAVLPKLSRETFDAADADHDGTLSLTEFEVGVDEGYFRER